MFDILKIGIIILHVYTKSEEQVSFRGKTEYVCKTTNGKSFCRKVCNSVGSFKGAIFVSSCMALDWLVIKRVPALKKWFG